MDESKGEPPLGGAQRRVIDDFLRFICAEATADCEIEVGADVYDLSNIIHRSALIERWQQWH